MANPPTNVNLWSREGFVGSNAISIQPGYTPDFHSADGPHAPRRIDLTQFATDDLTDPQALPTVVMTSRQNDARILLSRRVVPTPFTQRNTEAEELHFILSGSVRFHTEFGVITASATDLVAIPKSIAYRVTPLTDNLVDMIMESAGALNFDTPAPFGMIDFDRDVVRATIEGQTEPKEGSESRQGESHTLLLKTLDEVTRFEKPVDPLDVIAQVGGEVPIWRLNLADIQPISYGGIGGPPAQFLSSPNGDNIYYTLSARAATMRAPVHHNADYDELIIYAKGPGPYGAVSEPGTLTIVPKGVTHHGPEEGTAENYLALLFETRSTMRFTPIALKNAKLMETSQYGIHPSEA